MTATLETRPDASSTSSAPPSPPGGERARRRESRPRPELAGVSDVAVFALTAAAILGLSRLFVDSSFLGPALLAAALSHALARAARRLPLWAAATLSLAGLVLAAVWIVEPQTTSYGIPHLRTWHAIGDDITRAWHQFADVVAPAPVTRGFVLGTLGAAWVAAFLADAAAFRLDAPFEAVIPSFTIFVFGATLAADPNRLFYTGIYLTVVLAFLLVRSATRRAASATWFAGRRRGGAASIARSGVGVAFGALVLALVIGPNLPGAHSPALVTWRDRGDRGPQNRSTISPLVDIKNRLVNQSTIELFTVKSASPAYWRLTSLDRFDGEIWSSLGTYRPATGTLPGGVSSKVSASRITQEYAIEALSSLWLPAAYRPARLDGAKGVRYDAESSSLITETGTSDGLDYRVESDTSVPNLSAAQLNTAPRAVPSSIGAHYLELPGDFPSRVVRTAQQVTAGASTPYAKARALQDWFRTNFTYDENVPPGHSDSAIERFLYVTRRGYCEQFAGSYAAMARAIGLPTRVAVGFRVGELDDEGTFHVLGRYAHAWPEVYLSGFGWVAFEPTPTRSLPGGQSYTGVAPQPADVGGGGTTATTAPPTPTTPRGPQPTTPPRLPRNTDVNAGGTARHHRSRWSTVGPLVLLALAGFVVLGAAAMPLARRWQRARRRAQAASPADRVVVAWEETREVLSAAGAPPRSWETTAEYAARAARVTTVPDELGGLAADTAAALYSSEELADERAERAFASADAVRADVVTRARTRDRLWWAIDPRPLFGKGPASRAPDGASAYSSRRNRRRRRFPASPK